MTTQAHIKAALGDVRFAEKHLRDVDKLRAFFRWAIEKAWYESSSTPDFATIIHDADKAGFEASEDVKDESIIAAAHLEGLIPAVLAPGSKANAVLWPHYCGTPEDHARHAELLYSGVDGAHDSLIPTLIGDRKWEQGIRERREAVATRVTRNRG